MIHTPETKETTKAMNASTTIKTTSAVLVNWQPTLLQALLQRDKGEAGALALKCKDI